MMRATGLWILPMIVRALDINHQYMFGRSILVCPVTEAMYSEILERGFQHHQIKETLSALQEPLWYDFWTGESTMVVSISKRKHRIDIIPLYVKAGSIVPFGPKSTICC